MDGGDIPPHHTIYINNLNEKIKKPELVRNLYYAFSQFGQVLEVHAQRSKRLRGQAWILFDKIDSATQAVRKMNKFVFFGKPMRVDFSKNKSDTLAKQDGTWRPRLRLESENKTTTVAVASPQRVSKKRRSDDDETEAENTQKKSRSEAMDTTEEQDSKTDSTEENKETPNKILFVENLPAGCTTEMLQMLFTQYDGFVEARLITGKSGIAFVEFSDAYHAGHAKDTLQGFKITGSHHMKITFARK